ncbi:cell division FtsA domain-containing protein, partial [Eggerthella lenta]|nr:cell division FtsA domain-containing protein [Eggerthella lenta]
VDPEGGQLVTRDISTVLNTSMRNAERLKRDHGYADSRMADENVQLPVDVVGQNQPVEYSEKYLAEIIEARIRQIFQRISNRLKE